MNKILKIPEHLRCLAALGGIISVSTEVADTLSRAADLIEQQERELTELRAQIDALEPAAVWPMPCPFCAVRPLIERHAVTEPFGWRVRCHKGCGCATTPWLPGLPEAVSVWNRRMGAQ